MEEIQAPSLGDSESQPRRHTKTIIFWTSIAVAIFAILLWGGDWEVAAAQYHSWRLDRAGSPGEAEPWIEAIGRDARAPRVRALLLDSLGPRHPKFTFWFFLRITSDHPDGYLQDQFTPRDLPSRLLLLRGFVEKLQGREKLLALWCHFIRWLAPARLKKWDYVNEGPGRTFPIFPTALPMKSISFSSHGIPANLDFKDLVRPWLAREPERLEAWFRLFQLEFLGRAWVAGMPFPLEIPEFERPRDDNGCIRLLEALEKAEKAIHAWLAANHESMRFQPALGRYSLSRGGSPEPAAPPAGNSWDLPRPEAPLPGWQGPVPPIKNEAPLASN
ncbi:MAG: hypothetical protein HY717_15660 [Planctomycetes bacterium]|nr:hypothetical protein [Planctomycetota bacterium]